MAMGKGFDTKVLMWTMPAGKGRMLSFSPTQSLMQQVHPPPANPSNKNT